MLLTQFSFLEGTPFRVKSWKGQVTPEIYRYRQLDKLSPGNLEIASEMILEKDRLIFRPFCKVTDYNDYFFHWVKEFLNVRVSEAMQFENCVVVEDYKMIGITNEIIQLLNNK